MNILLLKDPKILRNHLDYVKDELSVLYKTTTDIDLTLFEEELDFTSYPKEVYYRKDGEAYEGMKKAWLKERCADVYRRWSEEVDVVVFLCHRDNWNLNGVWGWNISNQFSGYGVAQVRFDDHNLANSVGTLYHELMHDHDTFVFVNTGEVIEDYVNVRDWDASVVHGGRDQGGHPLWKYIRHKENQEALMIIAPFLRTALAKRRAIFDRKVGTLREIINILERVVVLQRALIARQRGDIALLDNHHCICGK